MTIKKLNPPGNDDRLILRTARIIPIGYKEHPTDKNWLIPVPEELELIKQAKEYSKTCSVREVANWLSAKLGRKVSHMWVARNCSWGQRNEKYERHEGKYEVRHYSGRRVSSKATPKRTKPRNDSQISDRQTDTGQTEDSPRVKEDSNS